MNGPYVYGPTKEGLRTTLGAYSETLRTIASIYDVGKAVYLRMKRSDAAKRGWVTRRANAAARALG